MSDRAKCGSPCRRKHLDDKLNKVNPHRTPPTTPSPLWGDSSFLPDHFSRDLYPASTLEVFQSRMELARHRLRNLVEQLEQIDFTCIKNTVDLRGRCAELSSALSDFRSLCESELAWQDIHGGDSELLVRAEELLVRLDSADDAH